MDLIPPISLKEIAGLISAKIIGKENLLVSGINEIHKVRVGDLMFVDNPNYYQKAFESAATVIIIGEIVEVPEGKAILLCKTPFEAYNQLTKYYRPTFPLTANISKSAKIHKSTIIEPGVIIGNKVNIGKNCYIHTNAVILDHSTISDDVIIHAGAVIGGHAFYYKKELKHYKKWHTCGRVIIKSDVEIGCNTTIDKGVSGDTIIGEGTKIDNLCHIGHGVIIGKNCLLAAQVGISGKVTIGDNCTLYGQVGISQRISLGDNTTILAQSGVSKSLNGNSTYFGSPAEEIKKKYKELTLLRRLPDLLKKSE